MGKQGGAGASKRKKHHDKDKYYILAKEQGLRSRAAFKLSQLNRKFPLLQGCKIVLDLCAAPGGWTQIAARTIPRDSHIVAVDILPIRPFRGFQKQISTLIGDITTAKCKADINKTLKLVRANQGEAAGRNTGGTADLVLHDGAPNVGASYDKDAYEQNEIAVHALKCATQHLKAKGHFVTKVYRSRDYASFLWICQQFFEQVTAFKPKASRAQSAEIFLVCQRYKAPEKVDPRMLDPKHIFELVEGESTGGKLAVGSGGKGIHIFHKQWDQKRRQREGYDHSHLDATLRHIQPVANFLQAEGIKDAIGLLGSCTGFSFACDKCRPTKGDARAKGNEACHCQFFLRHPLTTPETKACVSDLKVLNKRDFKGLLAWRTQMQDALEASIVMEEDDEDDGDHSDYQNRKADDSNTSGDEEADVQAEIRELKQKRQREKKKAKKKERSQVAKRRREAALGMDLSTIGLPQHSKIFSLATITSKGHLEAAAEVNLDHVTGEMMPDQEEECVVDLDKSLQEDNVQGQQCIERGYSLRLDQELDEAYDRYLTLTKDGVAKSGTIMEKRKRKSKCINAIAEADEDEALVLKSDRIISDDARAYAEMLHGPKDSDDAESSDDDDGSDVGLNAEPMTQGEFAAAKHQFVDNPMGQSPLIHTLWKDSASAKTARWFSNPIFANIGQAAESAAAPLHNDGDEGWWERRKPVANDGVSDDGKSKGCVSEDRQMEEIVNSNGNEKKKKTPGLKGLDAEEVLKSMPKTDRERRHEKRLKAMARDERKKARKAKKAGEAEATFEIAPANDDSVSDEKDDNEHELFINSKKKKVLEACKLIKAGVGKPNYESLEMKGGFVVVSALEAQRPLPALDERDYGSDKEDYDSDDKAETLALGTMMLHRSKAKALVDASYNRYAWNDPQGLPDWFLDDESKHYRPKLPLPPALIAKIKEKQIALSEKPIKKVAEARARKSKKAKMKLVAAKKKAEAVANNSDMSEAMKLKAISKALRQSDAKRPSKTYVVAKKGSAGTKGVQLVDKRLKSDKRSLERAATKRKKGKQNKLVGLKKRRQHK